MSTATPVMAGDVVVQPRAIGGVLTKSSREIMEILEAYDRTQCAWSAAKLAGVDAKTVARYVEVRGAGGDPFEPVRRPRLIDPFMANVEQLVDLSECQVRADVVHERLVAMGFAGDERSTRRAVAELKQAWRDGHRRKYRPWVPEPGMSLHDPSEATMGPGIDIVPGEDRTPSRREPRDAQERPEDRLCSVRRDVADSCPRTSDRREQDMQRVTDWAAARPDRFPFARDRRVAKIRCSSGAGTSAVGREPALAASVVHVLVPHGRRWRWARQSCCC
jgi:hypothetical protein